MQNINGAAMQNQTGWNWLPPGQKKQNDVAQAGIDPGNILYPLLQLHANEWEN